MNNHKNGNGMLHIDDELQVQGIFQHGKLNEEYVTIQFPNKVVYKGEISNMKLNGCGKLSFDDQSTFQGNFQDNVPDGPCSYETHKKNFKANFKNGIPEGIGYIYSKNMKDKKQVEWNEELWESKTLLPLVYLKLKNFDK